MYISRPFLTLPLYINHFYTVLVNGCVVTPVLLSLTLRRLQRLFS